MWGHYLVDAPELFRCMASDVAVGQIVELLAELGFTNLVLVFSEHFGRTLTRQPDQRIRWQPAVTNAGVLAVLLGVTVAVTAPPTRPQSPPTTQEPFDDG